MDASPEVLEAMGVAANIHEDDTITPDGGKLMVGQAMSPTGTWSANGIRNIFNMKVNLSR